MSAGFARLQNAENELVPAVLAGAGVDWVLECAPAAGPSPQPSVPRHRMLLAGDHWIWPCRLPARLLPFADDSLPAIMIRHLFWLPQGPALLEESIRCLKPGGLLVSISANPWHRGSWQELGRDALHLPAWPRFLMQHARHRLLLQVPRRERLRGLVAPLLLIVARKPPRAAPVTRLRFPAGARPLARPLVSNCRAA